MDHASTTPLAARSAARPPAQPLTVEAEASLMNRGRGSQLLIAGAAAVLLVGAGLLLLQRINNGEAYAQAAAMTTQIERDHFDAFFACALPGVRRSQLSSPERVHSAFESLGDRLGKAYGKTLATCSPHMDALTAGVQRLHVPEDVGPQHAELVTAASALSAANAQYLRYLSDGANDYEYVVAMPLLEKFGAAWARYRAAQGDLKQALEERQ